MGETEKRLANLEGLLHGLATVNRAIALTADVEEMLQTVLATVVDVFPCDGAWLLHPCDPEALVYRLPFAAFRPARPTPTEPWPVTDWTRRMFTAALGATEPLLDQATGHLPVLAADVPEHLRAQSRILIALRPLGDDPWLLGLQHSAKLQVFDTLDREWVAAVAGILTSGLTALAAQRDAERQTALDLRALRESESMRREMELSARIGAWAHNLKTGVSTWTKGVFEIYGVREVPPLEAEMDFYAPHCRSAIAKAFSDLVRTGTPYDLELEFVSANQQRLWVRVIGKPRYRDGKVAELFGVIQDITDRKHATLVLEQQKLTFEALFEAIPDALVLVDKNHRITSINRGFTQMFGYSLAEVAGQRTTVIYESEEEFSRQGRERYNLSAEQATLPYVVSYKRKDGEVFRGETIGTKVVMPDGAFVGYFGLVRDISDRLRHDEALRQSQKMEAIGTLSGGIAHDFNNILGAILGFATLLKERMPLGSEEEDEVAEILRATRRAKKLVAQILTFSRPGSDARKPVRLHKVIEESLKLLRQTIPTTIHIEQELAIERDTVLGDPTQLQQVMMNLCTNAYHAMKRKGNTLAVKLDTTPVDGLGGRQLPDLAPGPVVRLTVKDNGEGMTADTLTKLFEPFFTTKGPGEGSGMGMAVVHGIVKAHGGSIRVDSRLGEGTVVQVYLPHHQEDRQHPAGETATSPVGTERILVVDDEPVLARMIAKLLSRLGYSVEQLQSSTDALNRFRDAPDEFDLVITDQTMPEMPGGALAQELLRQRPDLPIIICTGHSETMSEERARQIGVRALLHKPLERNLLARGGPGSARPALTRALTRRAAAGCRASAGTRLQGRQRRRVVVDTGSRSPPGRSPDRRANDHHCARPPLACSDPGRRIAGTRQSSSSPPRSRLPGPTG